MKKITFYLIFLIIIITPVIGYSQSTGAIYHIKIDGTVNPSSFEYIRKAIHEAKVNNASCLIIELNTPGGLLKSTRYIVFFEPLPQLKGQMTSMCF